MKVTWLVAALSATAYAAPEAEHTGYSPNWAAFGEVMYALPYQPYLISYATPTPTPIYNYTYDYNYN